jgi:hypothetical protein
MICKICSAKLDDFKLKFNAVDWQTYWHDHGICPCPRCQSFADVVGLPHILSILKEYKTNMDKAVLDISKRHDMSTGYMPLCCDTEDLTTGKLDQCIRLIEKALEGSK